MDVSKYFDKRMKELKVKEHDLRTLFTDEEFIQRLSDALGVIENIAMYQEELPKNLNTEKEKQLHSAINSIYRIAHTARLPGCFDKHESWEEEFQKCKNEML